MTARDSKEDRVKRDETSPRPRTMIVQLCVSVEVNLDANTFDWDAAVASFEERLHNYAVDIGSSVVLSHGPGTAERPRQTVAQLRTIERLYQELEQVNHDMVYGGYVHPSYWTDGREKRRQWAQSPLDGDGHAVCVAAAKEAM